MKNSIFGGLYPLKDGTSPHNFWGVYPWGDNPRKIMDVTYQTTLMKF